MNINYILDIGIILITLLFFFWGKKKGIIGMITGFILSAVSIISAKIISSIVAIQAYNITIKPILKEKILELMGDTIPSNIENFIQNDFLNSIPSFFSKAIKSYGEIGNIPTATNVNEFAEVLLEKIAQPPIIFILSSFIFIIVFILCLILCKIFYKTITKIISKLPFIGSTNKLLGGIVGICFSFAICFIITKIFALYIGLAGDTNALNITIETINKTYIFKYLYFL